MTPTNYYLAAFTKNRISFTTTATTYLCQYPAAARTDECRACRTAKRGSLYERKRVKFYQNSPNLHFACDFGEVLVFRGTHRLPWVLEVKVKGDFLAESHLKVNMSSTQMMIRKNSAMNYAYVLLDSEDNAVTVFLQQCVTIEKTAGSYNML